MNQNNLVPFKKGFDERRQVGRKTGSKNISTIIDDVLNQGITEVKSPELKALINRQKSRTVKEAIVYAIVKNALSGELKSAQWLVEMLPEEKEVENSYFNQPIEIHIVNPDQKDKVML